MQNREAEQYSNSRGESKSEEQTRLADAALQRGHSDFPEVGSGATPQSEVTNDRRIANDSSEPNISHAGPLSWGAGEPFVGPGGLSGSPRAAAAISGFETGVSPTPSDFGRPVSSSPLSLHSNSGSHWNTADILRGGK